MEGPSYSKYGFYRIWKHFFLVIVFRRVCKIPNSDCFIMSVCLSVRPSVRPSLRMEKLGFHWTDFDENWYLSSFFFLICRENSSFIKPDNNNGHFTWRRFHIYDNILLNYSQNETIGRCACLFYCLHKYIGYLNHISLDQFVPNKPLCVCWRIFIELNINL
jgi:hypothetical protein